MNKNTEKSKKDVSSYWSDLEKSLEFFEKETLNKADTTLDSLDLIDFDCISDTSILDTSISKSIKHPDYKDPTPIRISTMTAVTNLFNSKTNKSIKINLECFAKNISVNIEDGPIISVKYGDLPERGLIKKKGKNKKGKKRKNFFNQATIRIKIDKLLPNKPVKTRIINTKIFLNGGIQMTGLKSKEEGLICITKVIMPLLLGIKSPKGKFALEDAKEIEYRDFKIVLINSDFTIGFEIKRDILYDLLVSKYNFYASYEPCIYPGINSKYFWNTKYTKKQHEGVCYCTKVCNGKGCGTGDGECKKITISIFQSGSVIITGARSIKQIDDAYKFINKVFRIEYLVIKKNKKKLHLLENKKKIFLKKSSIKF